METVNKTLEIPLISIESLIDGFFKGLRYEETQYNNGLVYLDVDGKKRVLTAELVKKNFKKAYKTGYLDGFNSKVKE